MNVNVREVVWIRSVIRSHPTVNRIAKCQHSHLLLSNIGYYTFNSDLFNTHYITLHYSMCTLCFIGCHSTASCLSLSRFSNMTTRLLNGKLFISDNAFEFTCTILFRIISNSCQCLIYCHRIHTYKHTNPLMWKWMKTSKYSKEYGYDDSVELGKVECDRNMPSNTYTRMIEG